MRVIALVTQKGGCGKTTLATCLAVAAEQAGLRTLILDVDPQGSALAWWQDREAKTPDCIQTDGNAIGRALEVARQQSFALVFIDTPGRDEPINAAAIRYADFCLIPCRPSLPDMRAQEPTASTVRRLHKAGGFILTQAPPRGTRVTEARRGLAVYSLPVAPTCTVTRTAFPDAYSVGLGVTEYEPDGKAAQEITTLWKWITNKMEKWT